ncbi:DUF3939 domain-containing protein [Staphylococcus capitis]
MLQSYLHHIPTHPFYLQKSSYSLFLN